MFFIAFTNKMLNVYISELSIHQNISSFRVSRCALFFSFKYIPFRVFPPLSILSSLSIFLFESISFIIIISSLKAIFLLRISPFRVLLYKVFFSSKYIPIQSISSFINILLVQNNFPSILLFKVCFPLVFSSSKNFSLQIVSLPRLFFLQELFLNE